MFVYSIKYSPALSQIAKPFLLQLLMKFKINRTNVLFSLSGWYFQNTQYKTNFPRIQFCASICRGYLNTLINFLGIYTNWMSGKRCYLIFYQPAQSYIIIQNSSGQACTNRIGGYHNKFLNKKHRNYIYIIFFSVNCF